MHHPWHIRGTHAAQTAAHALMKLSQLLSPEAILLPFTAADKWAAIRSLPGALAAADLLPERLQEPAVEALLQRERSMTTGMEGGIAIPHAALDGLETLVGVMAVAPQGIPFESLDRKPATILVGLLIPRAEKLLHIRTLAEIAKLLSRAEVRDQILAVGDPRAALGVIEKAGG